MIDINKRQKTETAYYREKRTTKKKEETDRCPARSPLVYV